MELTAVEEDRGFSPDAERVEIVEETLAARKKVKDARDQKLRRKYDMLAAECEADPYKWPCPRCVGNESLQELMCNFGILSGSLGCHNFG